MRQQPTLPAAAQQRAPLVGHLFLLGRAPIVLAGVAGSVRLGAGEMAEGAPAQLRGDRTGMAANQLEKRL